jgi:hypothetical protein
VLASRQRAMKRLLVGVAGTALAAGSMAALTAAPVHAAGSVPRYDHVVVVTEENEDAGDILGSSDAPYINGLADGGASFQDAHAEEHHSEGNYVALLSGSDQGIDHDDPCPVDFGDTDNLGKQLSAAGKTFSGYSEDLPYAGYTGCNSGDYARKHNATADFNSTKDGAHNQPFSSFPTDFTKLPTVSFVAPNLCNDMHDCDVSTGDDWLKNKIGAYAEWAKTHNSLLIVTWDEDSGTDDNKIATIFYGANVKTSKPTERIDHYSVLRTLEDMYGLSSLGSAASRTPITDVWNSTAPATQVVSLKAHANGKYVTAENNGAASLIADSSAISDAGKFDLIKNADGSISLKAHANSKYVTAENHGTEPLIANRDAIGGWEEFDQVKNADGSISLKAHANSKYVTAENAGTSPLIANRDWHRNWEEFDLIND